MKKQKEYFKTININGISVTGWFTKKEIDKYKEKHTKHENKQKHKR